MGDFKVAFFSDPPVASWAVPELLKAKVPLSAVVTILPRVIRFDAGDELRKIADSWGVQFFRPPSLSSDEFVEALTKNGPTVIASMSFMTKIPEKVRKVAKYCINAHPALLPRYRGPIPFFWTLYRREKKTGLTIHEMTGEFDAGDIHFQEEIPIGLGETTGSLAVKCYAVGFKLLVSTLQQIREGNELPRRPQNPKEVTYAPLPDATVLAINWNKPAEEILSLVRAASPFLGAYTLFRNLQLRVWSASLSRPNTDKKPPGTLEVSKGKVEVAAPDNFIALEVMQLEALRYYSGNEFLTVPGLKDGEILGRTP